MTRYKEGILRLMPEYPPPYTQHEAEILKLEGPQQNVEEIPEVATAPERSQCRFRTWCIGCAFLIFISTFFVSAFFPYPMHASCTVKWKFSEPCSHVMQRLRCQILKWSTCNDCGPRGSKCLYSLTVRDAKAHENTTITATHVTPNLRFLNRIKISFQDVPNNTCTAMGQSESSEWFVVFDYGSNYCNLHNLIVGAGFDVDHGFLEISNNAVCTQLSMAVCG